MRTFAERRIASDAISSTDMVSKDGKQMGAQQGNGQEAAYGGRSSWDFGISRSRLGWLSVRFDGGPFYPEMVATLKDMVEQHRGLIKRGERISGSEWLRRIDQSSLLVTEHQKQAIQTLMKTNEEQ